MTREAFPLQWPEGWKRTASWQRRRSTFGPHFTVDRDNVLRWLERRGSKVVITSDLPRRQDGLPYFASNVSDPGIAVWWVEKGHERVVACDRWIRADENMRAIAKTLEAMRGLDRWGATEMVERAFHGFAALPAGDGRDVVPPAPTKRAWHEVLDVTDLFKSAMLADTDLLAIVKQRHRERILVHHPDRGGDAALAAELNEALAEAEKELANG